MYYTRGRSYGVFNSAVRRRKKAGGQLCKAPFHVYGRSIQTGAVERIEDEYDVTVANDAYREYVQGGKKSKPVADLWKELEL